MPHEKLTVSSPLDEKNDTPERVVVTPADV